MSATCARDVGAFAAHRDADVRRAQGRAVVDAVAGHRDDMAVGLQRLDDVELVDGAHAREHMRLRRQRLEHLGLHLRDLPGFEHAQLAAVIEIEVAARWRRRSRSDRR